MKATDLKEALRILDPERPLDTDEELDNFFVERSMSPLEDLIPMLQDTEGHQKILFTGHRGSGKSTELAQLERRLAEEFFIIRYSVKSVLDLFDLSHLDIVYSLGFQLFEKTTSQEINVDKKVLKYVLECVLDFTKDITKETQVTANAEAGLGAQINFYVAKLSSKLGTEETTRKTIREKVGPRLSDLLLAIDLLSREVEKNTNRRVLVIVEDIDKTDIAKAKELFYGNATSLLAPRVPIIYTFPIALRHDNDFMQIQSNFPNPYGLPNIKTRARNGTLDEEGLGQLRNILTKRVDESLFTSESLNSLAELSGGIPRELITLARQACLEAIKSDAGVINENAVQPAASKRRRDYQVLLSKAQVKLLKQVEKTKEIDNNEDYRALLHNLSVLEFRNEDSWYDVNPVVKPLLTRKHG
ncbi:MAG: hypothetical protein ABIH23_25655 [bacterium]